MRGMTAILLCGSVFGAVAHGADRTFPYTAQISVDEVEVRCGPGWDYYATQRLPRGTRVEVYRQDAGGWLAIRPPEGSFSWVTARQVKATPEKNVAEVILDGAVAWVGSSTTNVPQHKWQVRLARGERVEVLGELAMTVGPGFATETYHKIAPPAGEFRWIHAQHALSPNTAAQETVAQSRSQNDYRHVGGPTASAPADLPSAVKATLSSPELAKQVEELNIALSLLVTREIDQWDLDSLKQRADALAQQAADTKLSQEIKAISQRMEEFETLQRRYRKAQERDVSNHQVGSNGAGHDSDGNDGDATTARTTRRSRNTVSRPRRVCCGTTGHAISMPRSARKWPRQPRHPETRATMRKVGSCRSIPLNVSLLLSPCSTTTVACAPTSRPRRASICGAMPNSMWDYWETGVTWTRCAPHTSRPNAWSNRNATEAVTSRDTAVLHTTGSRSWLSHISQRPAAWASRAT